MLCIFCELDFFIVAIMLFLIPAHFERLLVMPCIQGGHNFAPLTALQSLALPYFRDDRAKCKGTSSEIALDTEAKPFPIRP